MKNIIVLFSLVLMSSSIAICQDTDRLAAKTLVKNFFFALQKKDTVMLSSTFLDDEVALVTSEVKGGKPEVHNAKITMLIGAIGSLPESISIEEWTYDWQVEVDRNFASVGCKFTFYENNQFSHCGRNQFNLAKTNDGWKITHIMDSKNDVVNPQSCEDRQINTMLNNWHKAATDADADAFFGSMTRDCIYLGTDPSERWLRDELRSWAVKAFDKAPAWDFKTISRRIYIHEDGKSAWFEENLDTWMGECRGSGIVERQEDNSWKIRHYNLAMTIKNEKMKEVIEVTKEK